MGIQSFLCNVLFFLNYTLIPFLIAIAFLFFIWNMARYFIIQGRSEESRQKAKRNAIYGILAFVVITSLWGIVNLLVFGLGFDRERSVNLDYAYTVHAPTYEGGGGFFSSGGRCGSGGRWFGGGNDIYQLNIHDLTPESNRD